VSNKPEVFVVRFDQKNKSEYKTHTHSFTKKQKAITGIAAIGLVASGVAAGHYTATERANLSTIKSIANEAALQEAEATQIAQLKAKSIADAINSTINNPNLIISTLVLNGTITQQLATVTANRNLNNASSYKNAFMLYNVNDQKLDIAGNFLKGSWLGVSGNDTAGRVTITPILFDPSIMRFEANHTGDSPVVNVGIQAVRINLNGNGSEIYAAYAYDPKLNQPLYNDDGTPIIAGFTASIN